MELKQRTLSQEVSVQGVSLHTGEEVELTLKPAPANTGIVFKRIDLPESPEVRAHYELIGDLLRNTTLVSGHAKVHTVEHVVSALRGMDIDNAIVELNASEPPILDGSAKQYVDLIEKATPIEQETERKTFKLAETINVEFEGKSMIALPYDGFKITCTFADERGKYTQYLSIDIDHEVYQRQIAPARTFTFYEDIEALIKAGKIKGGSLDSAIVIKEDKIMAKEPLRFEDEFVRHKILDIVGDLSLLGMPIKAHIIATKPGHAINSELTKKLGELAQSTTKPIAKQAPKPAEAAPAITDGAVMDIQAILDFLPHRYPFLLVDRVIGIDENTITAIKNVTINEPFFVGHFPAEPVMPGVLQVEAMAQVAGILLLNKINDAGRIAYFMSCDKVKFRKKVIPGDQIRIECELKKLRGNKLGQAYAECKVNDEVVSSAELMFTLA